MARHLHIIFSAYSELTDPKAKKHAIIEEFVKLNGNRWKLNIEETIKQVTDNLLEIKQDFIPITQTDGYQSRHSSIDEGEVGISPSVEPGTGEQTETKERRLTH